ncbi:hypothetical protein GCM10010279_17480 [Streptomyces mutabilis]|nr:hypothetical protein GCM10010279_17480 [Streptomyces mutabilis]
MRGGSGVRPGRFKALRSATRGPRSNPRQPPYARVRHASLPPARSDFEKQIPRAFTEGFRHRPDTTFGTVNADVLEHFVPGFRHTDFVDVIENSSWPE